MRLTDFWGKVVESFVPSETQQKNWLVTKDPPFHLAAPSLKRGVLFVNENIKFNPDTGFSFSDHYLRSDDWNLLL